MGTGKSSVGALVAARLQFSLVDTDQWIESRAGKTIGEIFAQEGEAKFRELERAVLIELEGRAGLVISTGGGLIVDPANLQSLRRHAFIVCLWASPETIWKRVRHQRKRPLLQTPEPLETIRELLAKRERFYRKADALVNTERRTLGQVAQQVIHHYVGG